MKKTSMCFGKGVLALACSVATFAAQAVEVSTVAERVAAIEAVNAGGSDTTINVQPGTYDVSGVRMNADGHLYLGKVCTIQGTDATSWTGREGRDTAVVFDAKDVNRIFYVTNSVASPRFYHLTFQGGHAHTTNEIPPVGWDAYADTYARGGAISHGISGTSPASKAVVSNCVFRSNNGGKQGGGTYNCTAWNCFYTNNTTTSCGSAVINSAIYNCLIVDNRAGGNGAARNCGPISNCVFIANRVLGSGGAAYGSGATVTDCVFSNNWTSGSGGALCRENGNWTVSGCRFYGNVAAGSAGACNGIQTITNCWFEGNVCSNSSGGAVNNASNCVRCCTFVGNKASQYGGAASSSVLENCLFLTNSTPTTGGAVYKGAATNCAFAGNFSTNGGAAAECAAVNCAFTNNCAGNQGGAMYKGTAEGCDFYGNEAFGGDWSYGGGGCHSATLVTNCAFRRCVAWNVVTGTNAYGGGVKDCRNVVGCFFDDCHAGKGGAGCNSCLYDCVITNCWSPQTSWGDGADAVGMRGNASDTPCEIKRSKIYGRCVTASGTGRAIIKMYAEDCEIVGGALVWGGANRCIFRGTDGVSAMGGENASFTNSLFAGCYSSGYLFTVVSNMVNCTVTGCKGQLFSGVGDIVNSLFLGNDYNGEQVDLSGNSDSRTFRNCLYRTKPATFTVSGEGNIQIAADRGYGFVGAEANPEHPYALSYASPARNMGLTIGWPEGTTDLEGQARVNGQVDIGCYECWLPPVGTLIRVY